MHGLGIFFMLSSLYKTYTIELLLKRKESMVFTLHHVRCKRHAQIPQSLAVTGQLTHLFIKY